MAYFSRSTSALVDALTQLMLDVGIKIELGRTITAIRVNKNNAVTGVLTDEKRHIGCQAIIANYRSVSIQPNASAIP